MRHTGFWPRVPCPLHQARCVPALVPFACGACVRACMRACLCGRLPEADRCLARLDVRLSLEPLGARLSGTMSREVASASQGGCHAQDMVLTAPQAKRMCPWVKCWSSFALGACAMREHVSGGPPVQGCCFRFETSVHCARFPQLCFAQPAPTCVLVRVAASAECS
jgi:hypothetical protein